MFLICKPWLPVRKLLYGVSINGGTPNGWFIMGKNKTKMDDEQGYPYFRKPPYQVFVSFDSVVIRKSLVFRMFGEDCICGMCFAL